MIRDKVFSEKIIADKHNVAFGSLYSRFMITFDEKLTVFLI